jgi:succinyl-CoA synthetase beta subunit
MIDHSLMTKQTPPDGVIVHKVMVAQALDIEKETYFAILLDRTEGGAVLIGSPDGGVNIEEVAEETPDRIHKEKVQDLEDGPTSAQLIRLAKAMGFDQASNTDQAVDQMRKLYKLFLDVDATQVEM